MARPFFSFIAMRKVLFILLCAFMPLMMSAQSIRFAYFSYDEVFRSMPEYTTAQRQVDDLKAKYQEEAKRSTDDFSAKYEQFLEDQRTLQPSILRKRQSELQDLMDRNVAFKAESDRLLAEAEKKVYAPVHQKLEQAVREMAREMGYAFVLNADNHALPYVDAQQGDNITEALKEALRK